jgi:hypothetical protein
MLNEQPITLDELSQLPGPEPIDPVRFSRLKWMAESPAHYAANAPKTGTHIAKGSAVDGLILGTCEVCCYPGPVRRGKEWDAFQVANSDKLIVTKKELAAAEGMRASVLANEHATRVLAGARQKEVFWQYLGRDCVSHIDVVADDYSFVTDLKSARTSNPNRFRWQALKLGYHAQLAFYRLAVEAATGIKPRTAYIVAVESVYPYVTTVMRVTDKALELGERQARLWFETLLTCEKSNFWPGYAQGIVELDAPDDFDLEFDLDELVPAVGDE